MVHFCRVDLGADSSHLFRIAPGRGGGREAPVGGDLASSGPERDVAAPGRIYYREKCGL